MSEPERTYRMNEVTGEWEVVPRREPFIKSWWSLAAFLGFVGLVLGLRVIFTLTMH